MSFIFTSAYSINLSYVLGDVVYARFVANDVLIVNSAAAARVLMEKRGAKYSGRPLFTFLCELHVYFQSAFEQHILMHLLFQRWLLLEFSFHAKH